MRFVTCSTVRGPVAGRVEGDVVVLLDGADAAAAASAALEGTHLHETGDTVQLNAAHILSPSVRPSRVVCVGLNYATHIREMGRELPEYPTLFAKFPDALIGPSDDIVLPPEASSVDWEAELAVIVGRSVRRADAAQARDAIAGYSVANDVTMRDWQYRTTQWLAGKAWESSTPLGPVLVTPDEVDHAADLAITCSVNGVEMQAARTSDLLFDPGALVEYVSIMMTLRPGDVILTGTPSGVGFGRDPKLALGPGQVLQTSIEGIGELVNRCTV